MRKQITEVQNIAVKRLLSAEEVAIYTGLGRNTARKFCEEIGAVKRFGRRVLFDKKIIDQVLDQMTDAPERAHLEE